MQGELEATRQACHVALRFRFVVGREARDGDGGVMGRATQGNEAFPLLGPVFTSGADGSLRPQVRHQIRELLHRECRLESLRHQGEAGALERLDLRAGDGLLHGIRTFQADVGF